MRKRSSLLVALLRAATRWAEAREPQSKKSNRAERRRRHRASLKERAAFCHVFRERAVALADQVDDLQRLVTDLNAERERLQGQIGLHHEFMEDLGRRNAFLLDQCAISQHEAERWRRFVEDDRAREVDLMAKLHIN